MSKITILLDVGGTQIKGGIADEKGNIPGELTHVSAHAKEEKEVIFDHMAELIRTLMKQAPDAEVAGVGMAFPGPFDYEHGISLLKGLDKYESIYGCSVTEEMKKRIEEIKDADFYYLHDIESFAVGESWRGKAKNDNKILCLCIGTGTGTAFVEDHKILKEAKNGVPLNGWLYETPFKESKIDDYISVRGLARISREVLGKEMDGKALADLCEQGNAGALEVYKRFGEDLQKAILPFVYDFMPDAIVFGGQISKSFQYFGEGFAEECKKRKIRIHMEYETSIRAMQGVFIRMNEKK